MTRTGAIVRLPMVEMAENRASGSRRTARTGGGQCLSVPTAKRRSGRTDTDSSLRAVLSVRLTMNESLFEYSFISSFNGHSPFQPGREMHGHTQRVLPGKGAKGVRRASTNPARNHFAEGFRHHG